MSGACFLFLLPASCFPVLSVGGAVVVSVSSTQGRQGQSFGYVHIHGRSMASSKRPHYFRRSSTHTWDRGGEKTNCRTGRQLSQPKVEAGRAHLQIRLMRWLPLCPPLRSSKPQRFPPSLCNCGLKRPSAAQGREAENGGFRRTRENLIL